MGVRRGREETERGGHQNRDHSGGERGKILRERDEDGEDGEGDEIEEHLSLSLFLALSLPASRALIRSNLFNVNLYRVKGILGPLVWRMGKTL